MENKYEVMQEQAIAACEAARYAEALVIFKELLEVLKRFGAPLASSPTMYWYLVALHRGDEKAALEEFMKLEDEK